MRSVNCGRTKMLLPTLITAVILILTGCQPSTESSTDANKPATGMSMGKLLAADETLLLYNQVSPGNTLKFPQDHLSHDGYRIEWWYITANLTTENGEAIGIQWTQFRSALSPPASLKEQSATSTPQSPWATNQMFMAHVGLTSKNEHYSAEKFSRSHPQFAQVSANPFAIYLDNWRWQSHNNSPFPATLSVKDKQFGYQLSLDSQSPWQLQGEQGFSIKSADATVASHYYSQPYIKVSGTINRNGKTDTVTGQAWLDREWSSQLLTDSQQGWDWFSIRLDEKQTLMMFRLRGKQPQDSFYSARLMQADGSGRNITSASHPNDINMQPIARHTSQSTRYPTGWKIDIESENIHITTQALNPNSEMLLSTTYWEGPIQIEGTHSGMGYMELTGY
ncbi:lipocalin-like domain-containing protein [Shewanella sp. OMA3-2]|uniref:lipocalin-like domain-containing protein n=1 Tax=Shewanella sp. OMA3-2 TaxID=2908650 RepID=UPI001F320933|nr:lipocalin-like domain-containing protein [Shewanella sp. OMA3-2]UJF21775.1 carotenoid 1,2-hydratase [Shewanella sp. OMA3-2]